MINNTLGLMINYTLGLMNNYTLGFMINYTLKFRIVYNKSYFRVYVESKSGSGSRAEGSSEAERAVMKLEVAGGPGDNVTLFCPHTGPPPRKTQWMFKGKR